MVKLPHIVNFVKARLMTRYLRIQKGIGGLTSKSFEAELEKAKTSVRRWWWEYLRLSKDYWLICKTSTNRSNPRTIDDGYRRLFRDFGNIHSMDFATWYEKIGSSLFAERDPFEKVIEVDDQLANINHNRDGRLLLDIPLSLSARSINRQIGRILKAHTEQRYSLLIENTSSDYPINPIKLKVDVLKKMHEVWCLHREMIAKPKHISGEVGLYQERADLYRIGVALHLSPSYERLPDDEVKRREMLNKMRVTVSRYLSKANALITNVEFGSFPNYSTVDAKGELFSRRQKESHIELEAEWWKLDLHSQLSENKIEVARRIGYSRY
jgi:hypothetical protein